MNIQGAVSQAYAVSGAISAGTLVVNDYVIQLESVEGGTKLIVSRGNEAQTAIIADGVSPEISVEAAEGGYNLIVTDANGTNVYFLPAMGSGGGSGGEDGGYYTPVLEQVSENTVNATFVASKDDMPAVSGTSLTLPSGPQGEPGETPVKGVDYFTAEDIAQVAAEAAELVDIESVDAEKVTFSTDLTTTTAIGNITLENGQATIPAAGKNLKQLWETIFVKEKNPSTTQPSVSLSFPQAKAYEVGTGVTPSYSASLNAGSYTYGPETGVAATAWTVSDTAGNAAKTTSSGSFPELQVTDGIGYRITATATHGAGAIPLTNTGNEYAAGRIQAGSKSATSGAITGYRNAFYGTLDNKNDLTSDAIRSLTKSGKALTNGNSFSVAVPVGAFRVVIAYPASLRDVNSIKDVNGMNAEISSGFAKQTIAVKGANNYTPIDYKVYVMDFAEANDTANTFTVTI